MTRTSTRQIDQLSERLTEDITWRLREISAFKRSISASDDVHSSALLRASIPLLYAHWEGYFSVSTNAFLNFVASESHTTDTLQPTFWALMNMKNRNPNSLNSEIDVFRLIVDLRQKKEEPFRRGRYMKITAKSNLNFRALKNGCLLIGIDWRVFESYQDFIDNKLISDRNFIAHGESRNIKGEKFDYYRETVVEMMRILKNEIENTAYQQDYLL